MYTSYEKGNIVLRLKNVSILYEKASICCIIFNANEIFTEAHQYFCFVVNGLYNHTHKCD